jgi:hypothetical protein
MPFFGVIAGVGIQSLLDAVDEGQFTRIADDQ